MRGLQERLSRLTHLVGAVNFVTMTRRSVLSLGPAIVIAALSPAAAAGQGALIMGQVIESGTRRPLAGAHVTVATLFVTAAFGICFNLLTQFLVARLVPWAPRSDSA